MSVPFVELDQTLQKHSVVVCRGCLAASGEMKNMFDWGLAEEFTKFTDIQLIKSSNIAELLCTACEETLISCRSFRERCRTSDLWLRNAAMTNSTDVTSNEPFAKENTITPILNQKKLVLRITAPNMSEKIYLICPYCQGKYIKQKDLQMHLSKRHDTKFDIELQYYCTEKSCPYDFKTGKNKYFLARKYLNQHYIKVHMNKIFHCEACSSNFSTNVEFNRHLKTTCNITYTCELCNITYKSNEKLLVHLKRKHPDLHKEYKEQKKSFKRSRIETEVKKPRNDERLDYICDSPKRSSSTQTRPEENIKNDVTLPSWLPTKSDQYEAKTDEISTQTVFEDLLSLKSQTSEDESIFFSENVSLSDIQTQTFPLEFGLSRSNKETITSETQSPDLSMKETQTCFCLYDSPKINFKLFDSVSSSPSSINLTSTETQTAAELRCNVKSDVMLSFSSAETQTSFEDGKGCF